MSAHNIRVQAESKRIAYSKDANTNEPLFWWRGNDLDIELALTDNNQFLTASEVGSISVIVKDADALPDDPVRMLKVIGSGDCDASFTASDWDQGVKQLCTASFTKAEAALEDGEYVLIVSHDDLAGNRNTYLHSRILVKEDQHDSTSITAPPTPAIDYYTKDEIDARDENSLYILCCGQSNMDRTSLNANMGQASTDLTPDSRVQILDSATNTFIAWDLSQPFINDGIGVDSSIGQAYENSTIAFHFAKQAARVTGRTVKIIASAEGGKALIYWGVSNDNINFIDTQPGWVEIVNQIQHVPRVDVILWHQGETGGGRTKDEHKTALNILISQIRALPQVGEDVPFIAGEIFEEPAGDTNNALRELQQENKNFFLAEAPSGARLDAAHYSDDDILKFGREIYWDKFSNATRNNDRYSYKSEAAESQRRHVISVTTDGAAAYSESFKVAVGRIAGTAYVHAEFDLKIEKALNSDKWRLAINGMATENMEGVHVEVKNNTTSFADIIIHHANPLYSANYIYHCSIERLPTLDFAVASSSGSVSYNTYLESDSEYLNNSATNTGHVVPQIVHSTAPFLPIAQFVSSTGEAKKFTLTLTTDNSSPIHSEMRFEGYVEQGWQRSVLAKFTISKSSRGNIPDWRISNVEGHKAGIGIKVTQQNNTFTSVELVFEIIYEEAMSASYHRCAWGFVNSNLTSHVGAMIGTGKLTADLLVETQTDADYLAGGNATSSF